MEKSSAVVTFRNFMLMASSNIIGVDNASIFSHDLEHRHHRLPLVITASLKMLPRRRLLARQHIVAGILYCCRHRRRLPRKRGRDERRA